MPPADDRNDRERLKAIELAVGQIEKQFGKGSIMRLGAKDAVAPIAGISTGSLSLDYRPGRRRRSARPRGRDLRPGVLRQDDARAARHRGSAEAGRHGGVHRRRARARPVVRQEARRGPRRPAGLAAGQRRAGAGDRRSARPLRRRRRDRRRLGRGAGSRGPKSKARWATATWACRRA